MLLKAGGVMGRLYKSGRNGSFRVTMIMMKMIMIVVVPPIVAGNRSFMSTLFTRFTIYRHLNVTRKEGTTWNRKATARRQWKTLMEGYILQWIDKA